MTPDPNRQYMTPAEAKEFTKIFNHFNKQIISVLLSATTKAEVEEELGMLEGLAGYDLLRLRPCMDLPSL